MGDAADIILALAVMTIGLEVLLFVFKGPLLRVSQAQVLQGRIDAIQAEVTQVREQVATRQAAKTIADAELAKARAALKQAEEDLAAGRRPRELLLHRLGGPAGGVLFRASLTKILPGKAEPNQVLLWSRDNAVELQASDSAAAQKIAARTFAAKAGYALGPLQRLDLPVVFAPKAAQPREAA